MTRRRALILSAVAVAGIASLGAGFLIVGRAYSVCLTLAGRFLKRRKTMYSASSLRA